eukprot:CAMPEP_0173468720 /NCGR_PEP_ID=MMETSP1357-20121228/76991_1 /TAXON_ID=77926 /ORGANISM="Hemiselmis rufescens, Strain PCC563" /LENGTH=504 /DNA_ID=CAMNT_0014436945 /DNA_START=22 /DNA_END=1536 /DNA_ORIENTATION=+
MARDAVRKTQEHLLDTSAAIQKQGERLPDVHAEHVLRKLEELAVQLRILRAETGQTFDTRSLAQLGEEYCNMMEPDSIIQFNGGSSDPFADEACAQRCGIVEKERDLGPLILPLFRSLASDSGMVVLDSQEHSWLDNRKPDFTVLPNAYWICARNPRRSGDVQFPVLPQQVGKVAHKCVRDTVRCLIEVKLDIDNAARGQVFLYAALLGGSAHILLLDKTLKFEAFVFNDGTPVNVTRGLLTEPGSAGFVNQFVFRRDTFQIPSHELDLRAALDSFTCHTVEGEGFLGGGGSGKVFRVSRETDGCKLALKVFPSSFVPSGLNEVKNMQKLSAELMKGENPGIPSIIASNTLKTGAFAFLMSTVGEPIGDRCKREWKESELEGLFEAMSTFHQAGWCHGDARYHNFILVNDKFVPIDFVFASGNATSPCIQDDMLRLASSILELRGSNDLDKLPGDLLRDFSDDLYDELEKHVGEYCDNKCSGEDAVRIARTVYAACIQTRGSRF